MTKIKSVLTVALLVGLALGGIAARVGLLTNPVAMARTEPPKRPPAKEESPTSPVATKKDEKPHIVDQPAPLTDRQLLEDGGAAVYLFVAALHERYTDETAGDLRKYIDPRYLKEHGLEKGAFPIRRVVTKDIHSNLLSADPSTTLIVAATEDAAKECFLFRLTVHEGKVYIRPLSPPDKKSKSFDAWILRVKV